MALLLKSWLPSLMGIGLWLAVVLGLAEWLSRKTNIDAEVPRKVVHIGTGNVILLAWWFKTPLSLGLSASILFCAITLLSYRYPILPSVSGIGRRSWGTFFYAFSIGLLILLFWGRSLPQFAALGVLVMTWGDGLAAIVGKRFGNHPYELWEMKKSWEGSSTMFLVSFGIACSILLPIYMSPLGPGIVFGIALILGTISTGLEAFSKYGLDNLTVPLGTATLCYGLVQWFL